MAVDQADTVSLLEWLLGAAVSLYGATATILFANRHSTAAEMRETMDRLHAENKASGLMLHQESKTDIGLLWDELAKQRDKQEMFRAEILRDLRGLATKEDVQRLETAMTQQVRDGLTAAAAHAATAAVQQVFRSKRGQGDDD